ncbi:MAG: hypothetical protein KAY96_02400 [Bacteroidia bacterium]|nr:hypothetical protein [Bacteroidia bacterium]MBP6721485.1 hypothetical protein [Bacteroidia bacterium]MBP8073583.1 hypothetical protein [Bacteroidia bacterium]
MHHSIPYSSHIDIRTSFLVTGSAVVGLSFVLSAMQWCIVPVISKRNTNESNTKYAKGGNAAVVSNLDTFEFHVTDTLDSGNGLCNEQCAW